MIPFVRVSSDDGVALIPGPHGIVARPAHTHAQCVEMEITERCWCLLKKKRG